MATILSDVVFRDELRDYINVESAEKTAFLDSGIFVNNDDLNQLLAGPSNTFTIPWWVDLDASIESNYSNDVYTDVATPLSVATSSMQARAAYLNEGWAAMNLVKNIAKQDPLEFVGNRLIAYWRKVLQRRAIATMVGVYNANVAQDDSDMVHAATAGITAGDIIRARGTMGDYGMGEGSVTAMHSAVHTALSILNQIDYTPIADQRPQFGRYQGSTVIVDDGLPVIGATGSERYLTIIANPGAVGYAERQPPGEDGLEYNREPARGNGGGVETLWGRRDFIVHPFGYGFTSDTITGNGTETRPASASWADLVLADNWERKLDRKQVPIAFVTSTVAG